MVEVEPAQVSIRPAGEGDITTIQALFSDCYGDRYSHPEFVSSAYLRKMIYSDNSLVLVAEDPNGEIVATASVVIDVGAYADLIGEFGRLVVHPEMRGQHIGHRLMTERIDRVAPYLHIGFVDNRVAHTRSQQISLAHGFTPIGFLPIHNGEPVALFVQHFGDGLKLRRNHPRVAPQVYGLAQRALRSCGIDADAIVDEMSPPYGLDESFEIEEMSAKGYASLLRFERGRVKNPEIFGPARLHFGLRALESHNTSYLLARKDGHLVGAVGYAHDARLDHAVRIFELVCADEYPVRVLLKELMRRSREEWRVDYVEVDVNAHAPRMQRTLLELGFVPVAYLPAAVFHHVERFDTVRMQRFYMPIRTTDYQLIEEAEPVFEMVIRNLNTRAIQPQLVRLLPTTRLGEGLNREQVARLSTLFETVTFSDGDTIVKTGERDARLYIVLSGSARVFAGSPAEEVGSVSEGELLGEVSLLRKTPHTATAIADGPVEAAAVHHKDLNHLLQQRSDIGVVLFRNLATGLSDKLSRTDAFLSIKPWE
ncbi:MAG: GNAT family N-acetyltransferase [Myxococcales bacterium]|nr:GNAT family N-acetyltransferase [Myxococcales bacterium]